MERFKDLAKERIWKTGKSQAAGTAGARQTYRAKYPF
jgi:hypothetical protein